MVTLCAPAADGLAEHAREEGGDQRQPAES
jgi:hypothetical protein